MTDESTTIDVGSWMMTLVRNWWVIVGLIVIGIVVGVVVTKAQPKVYTATASVYIGQTTDANGNAMAGLNSNAKAATQLLSSQVVLKEAADRSGTDISTSLLRKETTVETPSSTVKTSTSVVNIVVISVTDTKKARATAAANALAAVLLAHLDTGTNEKIALLEAQLAQGQKQLAASMAESAAAQKAITTIAKGGGSPGEKATASAPYVAVVQGAATDQAALDQRQPEDPAAAPHGQAGRAAAHAARCRHPRLAQRPDDVAQRGDRRARRPRHRHHRGVCAARTGRPPRRQSRLTPTRRAAHAACARAVTRAPAEAATTS